MQKYLLPHGRIYIITPTIYIHILYIIYKYVCVFENYQRYVITVLKDNITKCY